MNKKFYLFLLFIPLILFGSRETARGTTTNVTTSTIIAALGAAANGDTLLLAPGTYTSAFGIQNNKILTIKSNGTGTVTLNFAFSASDSNTGGGLIFDGVTIDRAGGDFMSVAIGTVGTLAFRNCTIQNLARYIVRTTDATAKTMTNFEISNCIIKNCGTALSWALNRLVHHVQNVQIKNNTFYNYQGEDIFLSAAAAQNTAFDTDFVFENNTVYKCINATKGTAYAVCNAGNKFKTTSSYTFRNNIFNLNGVTGTNKSPYLLTGATNGKTLIAEKNLIVDFIGTNTTAYNYTTFTNVTKNDVTLAGLGLSSIGFSDPNNGDFSIPSTSPIATASTTNGILGDPRWLKVVTTAVNLTTSVSSESAGTVSPASGVYNAGDNVSVTATRNFGYQFKEWQDASTGTVLSTSNPYSFTINGNTNIKAVFQALTTYNFSVTTQGSQWGSVSLNPAPTNGKYEAGTEVAMTAVPNPIVNFLNWEDQSTGLSRTITVDADKAFTAKFDEVPFIVGWDFKAQTPTSARPADFYSETSNTGVINVYESVNGAAPVVKGWLASTGAFSPNYPHLRFWSAGTEFKTTRRHLKAQFATTNYKNVQVKSMICGNYQVYSVMTLQYSLDDVTYKEFARVDLTQTYGSSWKDLNAMLPAEAENQPKVYVKWIADTTSPILTEGTGNDGTAITNVFVFADKDVPADTDAPVFISSVPASESATATTTGSVILTFNEKLKAGSGNITLGTKVLTGSYGSKTVSFVYEKLSYDTEYTFTVPAGALTDLFGNAFAGLTFKFRTAKRTEPTKKLFDAVVAKDGSGDYTSVLDAIAAAPSSRTQPWLIYIKNGKYTGHHDIPSTKPFIHLIGQSRDNVIISDSRLSGGDNAYSVDLGATMTVNSKDVYFENLTLENSIGYDNLTGPQALALYAKTDRFTTNNVWLRSYQDTYLSAYTSMYDRQYLKNSKIEGAVDYIYGGGDVFFDKCTLTNNRNDGGYIVAPSHATGTLWGYVFSNCTIDASPRIANTGTNYFGRPWHNAPKTVFINTTLKTGIKPAGWYYKMNAIPAIFADYNTMDANGNPVDLSQRISDYEYDVKDANGNVTSTVKGTAKSSLTDAEAATYTYENVMLRSGDTWDPRLMTEAPENPSNVIANGASISWSSVPYSRLYIIFRDNSVLGFTTNTAYTDATAVSGQNYAYAVQAVGEYGALSSATIAASGVLPITGLVLKAERSQQSTMLNWTTRSEFNTSHFEIERSNDGSVFNVLGQLKAKGNSQSVSKYSFSDRDILNEYTYYRVKAIDLDGKYSHSNMVVVEGLNHNSVFVYPTIATNTIHIIHPKMAGRNSIEIYNLNGNKVAALLTEEGSSESTVNVTNLSAGLYIINYTNGTKNFKLKFIKQ